MPREVVLVNRAPVLTLWASGVAERLGYDHEAAPPPGEALGGASRQEGRDTSKASSERRSILFAGPWKSWPALFLPRNWPAGPFLFTSIFGPASRKVCGAGGLREGSTRAGCGAAP